MEDEGGGANLADLILEKIAAHEAATGENPGNPFIHEGGGPGNSMELGPKVVQVYSTYV